MFVNVETFWNMNLFPSQSPIFQCDAISVLEKEHDYREEHFDFIQSHIRQFCLQRILFIYNWLLFSHNGHYIYNIDRNVFFRNCPYLINYQLIHQSIICVITPTIVAWTESNRWSWPDLHFSQRGEEHGSALQIFSAQDVWVPVHHTGLSGGKGCSVHVSDDRDALVSFGPSDIIVTFR